MQIQVFAYDYFDAHMVTVVAMDTTPTGRAWTKLFQGTVPRRGLGGSDDTWDALLSCVTALNNVLDDRQDRVPGGQELP